MAINLDNEHDMCVVDDLIHRSKVEVTSKIGLRINPVVGAGAIGSTSTATRESKFGIPVTEETRNEVIELFAKYEWLEGLHIHVGSQGVQLQSLANAVKVMPSITS